METRIESQWLKNASCQELFLISSSESFDNFPLYSLFLKFLINHAVKIFIFSFLIHIESSHPRYLNQLLVDPPGLSDCVLAKKEDVVEVHYGNLCAQFSRKICAFAFVQLSESLLEIVFWCNPLINNRLL